MDFGGRIKELRMNKGITQKQLADMLYISSQAVSKWERGKSLPDINILPRLAVALGVNISDFFSVLD